MRLPGYCVYGYKGTAQYQKCIRRPVRKSASVLFKYYFDALKILNCDRKGGMTNALKCRVKKQTKVQGLCLMMRAGCMMMTCSSQQDRNLMVPHAWKQAQRRVGRANAPFPRGFVKTVVPWVCCHRLDKRCIRTKLGPHLKKIGKSSFMDTKNWNPLATADTISV